MIKNGNRCDETIIDQLRSSHNALVFTRFIYRRDVLTLYGGHKSWTTLHEQHGSPGRIMLILVAIDQKAYKRTRLLPLYLLPTMWFLIITYMHSQYRHEFHEGEIDFHRNWYR